MLLRYNTLHVELVGMINRVHTLAEWEAVFVQEIKYPELSLGRMEAQYLSRKTH